jgi:hypothetical protein
MTFARKQIQGGRRKGLSESEPRSRDLSLGFLVCALVSLVSSGISKAPENKPAYQKSDEFVVVSNPKTPKDPSLRIVFKEDLTIGFNEGDENYMLGERLWLNVDDKGNIHVADWDRRRIQKYGPTGSIS